MYQVRPLASVPALRAGALILACMLAFAGCQKEAVTAKGMGSLEPFLDIGTKGVWTGAFTDGVYNLTNTSEPKALRTITLLRTDDPNYGVGVDIAFDGEGDGAAGIVFAHNQETKRYYLLALSADGRVRLFDRTKETLETAREATVTLKDGFNHLAFEGEGNSVIIKVNGEQIGEPFVAQSLSEGGAGIAALGVGTFRFTKFETTGYRREPPTPEAAPDGQS